MDLRFASLLFLLVAAAAAAAGSSGAAQHSSLLHLAGDEPPLNSSARCSGLVGDCIYEEEETALDSTSTRRGLQQGRLKYISYQALFKDKIPCNHRGYSYYNCNGGGARRANPYRRSCTYITHCRRILN